MRDMMLGRTAGAVKLCCTIGSSHDTNATLFDGVSLYQVVVPPETAPDAEPGLMDPCKRQAVGRLLI